MLILSYSGDYGNNHNLASGRQYHQKNGFRNLELPFGVGYIFKFFSKYWYIYIKCYMRYCLQRLIFCVFYVHNYDETVLFIWLKSCHYRVWKQSYNLFFIISLPEVP